MDYLPFAENLRKLRRERGLTQEQLAAGTGVGQVSIAHYESGNRMPGIRTLSRMAAALDVPLQGLLDSRETAMPPAGLSGFFHQPLLESLLEQDIPSALAYLHRWRSGKEDGLSGIFSEILTPLMHHTGDLWASGILSVSEEHLISQGVRELIYRSAEGVRKERKSGGIPEGRWMGFSAPGEEHDLGLLMSSLLIREEGWEVRYPGGNLPCEDLAGMVRKFRPRILACSLTLSERQNGLAPYLEGVLSRLDFPVRLILGGQGVPENWQRIFPMARARARDLEEGKKLAVGLPVH